MPTLLLLLAVVTLATARPAQALQVPDSTAAQPDSAAPAVEVPADTYRDAGVRGLLERARAFRAGSVSGMESYEARMRERIWIGLRGLRFRRDRSLFEQERAARIRWERGGERAVQWTGARRRIPLVGDEGDAEAEIREDLAEELASGDTPMPLSFDPWDDRLAFGESWALHPLADSAPQHYRYAAGDTLRIRLPDGRTIQLDEVRVRPRRSDPHLVAGSLWFEDGSGALVRAGYRPARPFDLDLDEPEDAEDVPGFLKPITAGIDYVNVEYGLHELRFWLPRRFALEGEASVGRWLSFPLTVEWTVDGYEVDPEGSSLPLSGPLPPGWTRSEQRMEREGGTPHYITVIVPPADSLEASAELTGDVGPEPVSFSEEEIDELRGELEGLLPSSVRPTPTWAWGLQDGLTRFNRIEGLSAGVRGSLPLTPRLTLSATARLGVADLEPNGELALRYGPRNRSWTLAAYRRLDWASDWENPFALSASLTNLVDGDDRGEYYRAAGAELVHERRGRRATSSVRLFAERQSPAFRNTDFHLMNLIRGDSVTLNIEAGEGNVFGISPGLHWQRGLDPRGLVASGFVASELTVGDFAYQRLVASAAAARPLGPDVAAAAEMSLGGAWGDVPLQRIFYLGGTATLRGFRTSSLRGSAFWTARGELGTGAPGLRLLAFGDVGWAGPRETFTFDDPAVAVGVGASFLDGIARVDVARAVRRGHDWRVHLYLDALF